MRDLGSFNRRVNLPKHAEDYAPVKPERPAIKTLQTDGYSLGISRNAYPQDKYTPTGSKFSQSQGKPGRRMAGQALGLSVTRGTGLPSVPTASMIGSAELRTPNIPQ